MDIDDELFDDVFAERAEKLFDADDGVEADELIDDVADKVDKPADDDAEEAEQ